MEKPAPVNIRHQYGETTTENSNSMQQLRDFNFKSLVFTSHKRIPYSL